MFNIGGGELLVILLIALIVLGPQRLPDAARQIGKTMGDLRRLSTELPERGPHAPSTPPTTPTRSASRREVSSPRTIGQPAPATTTAPCAPRRSSRRRRRRPSTNRPPAKPSAEEAGASEVHRQSTKAAPAKKATPAKKTASKAAKSAAKAKNGTPVKKPASTAKTSATPHQDLMATSAVPDGARRRSHVAHGAPHGAPRPDHQDRHRARRSGWSIAFVALRPDLRRSSSSRTRTSPATHDLGFNRAASSS